jgi:hypothetical protein
VQAPPRAWRDLGAREAIAMMRGGSVGAVRRSYTIFWNAMAKAPPGGIRVTIEVPESWQEQLAPSGAPRFQVADLRLPGPALSATSTTGRGFAAAIEPMIEAGSERVDLGPSRVWISKPTDRGGVDGRIFVDVPTQDSVVMALVSLAPDERGRLAELRAVLETLEIP